MKILLIALIATLATTPHYEEQGYDVWSDDGHTHLMMTDNGTPDDYDDDWVVDWETNREFTITIID